MMPFVWSFTALDLWVGARCLLASLGLLRHRRCSRHTSMCFAAVLLAAAAFGMRSAITGVDAGLGLAATAGPWALGIAVMFVVLVTGRQQ